MSITAVSGFISWAGISGVHIRFRRAYVRQGRSVAELPYKAFGYPFSGLFATILCILIILGQGYGAFTPEFDGETFVMNYIGIIPFVVCYIGHKLITRKKIIPLEEVGNVFKNYPCHSFLLIYSCKIIDFESGRVTRFDIEKDNEEVDEALAKLPKWQRYMKKTLNVIS